MKLQRFSFHLPLNRIAQHPISPRDHSRLLVVDRKTKKLSHYFFYELPSLLEAGDVLVFNNSKVISARLIGRKHETQGKIEIFIVRLKNSRTAEVMIGNAKAHIGLVVDFGVRDRGEIIAEIPKMFNSPRLWLMRFYFSARNLKRFLETFGQVPTPPYIKEQALWRQYQTVYAAKEGSVAAPTAGFHFTNRLLKKLRNSGVSMEYLTLHVGLGTFQPIKTERVEDHRLHAEFASLSRTTAQRLNGAKNDGRRIIAVGTTTIRTLETFTRKDRIQSGSRWTNMFIYPPYKFQCVDAVITNFHLPRSSLLLLVMAFGGEKLIRRAYQEAIQQNYRFYSFGDAMLIV